MEEGHLTIKHDNTYLPTQHRVGTLPITSLLRLKAPNLMCLASSLSVNWVWLSPAYNIHVVLCRWSYITIKKWWLTG